MNWTEPKPGSSNWPTLQTLKLPSSEQLVRRRTIGGSDANTILSGDAERIRDLWLEKRGEKEPEDLSGRLAGDPRLLDRSLQSAVVRAAHRPARQPNGKRRGLRRSSVAAMHARRLDRGERTVWEAKHTSAFAKSEEVLERYMPQLQHNMAVTGYQRAMLSVIFGNHKYEVFEIASDWLYQIELLEAESASGTACGRGGSRSPIEPPPAPPAHRRREVCLEGNNAWASAAFDWLEHRDAAKLHARRLHVDQGAHRRGRRRGPSAMASRPSAARPARSPSGAGPMSAPSVYAAINAISAELAEHGIAKTHVNEADDYQYRSIDDLLDRLAPLLAKHRLCVLPRVLKRTIAERQDDGAADHCSTSR